MSSCLPKAMLVIFLLVFSVSSILVPHYRESAIKMRQASCYANLRVLQGAMEMFNMDVASGAPLMLSLDIPRLERERYLRPGTNWCPFGGSYSTVGSSTTDFPICCSFHGTPDPTIGGKSDPEFPWIYWYCDMWKTVFLFTRKLAWDALTRLSYI